MQTGVVRQWISAAGGAIENSHPSLDILFVVFETEACSKQCIGL